MSLFEALWEPASASASDVPFTPTGNIAATTVAGAIAELDTEKQPTATLITTILPTLHAVALYF